MAHKTPKLLTIPVHQCARTVAVFYFLFDIPTVQKQKTIAGYGVMGSKMTPRREPEPANLHEICKKNTQALDVFPHIPPKKQNLLWNRNGFAKNNPAGNGIKLKGSEIHER